MILQLSHDAFKFLDCLTLPGIDPSLLVIYRQMKQHHPADMRFVSPSDLSYIIRQRKPGGKKQKEKTEAQDLKEYLEKCQRSDPAFQFSLRTEGGRLESAIWATGQDLVRALHMLLNCNHTCVHDLYCLSVFVWCCVQARRTWRVTAT
jgi:hypothetical protein